MATASGETDAELIDRYKDVRLDHTNKHFYRGLLQKELRLNRCRDCGFWHHRPKPRCPRCLSKSVVGTAVQGRGTVHLLIFLHQGPPAEGVDYSSPHAVAVVELDEQEGLRFTSAGEGHDLSIGDRVELDWITRSGRPYPVWKKVSASRDAAA